MATRPLAKHILALLLACGAYPAMAEDGFSRESGRCSQFFARYERLEAIPNHLLKAISNTESGRAHPETGKLMPWPWAVHAGGKGYYFNSREEALNATRSWLKAGVRNMDIGCMQVNLLYHHQAFDTLEEAFDPEKNIAYAASFLRQHYERTSSWREAVGDYHSQTPSLGTAYAGRVIKNWHQLVQQGSETTQTASSQQQPAWQKRTASHAIIPTTASAQLVARPAKAKPAEAITISAAKAGGLMQDSGQDIAAAILAEQASPSPTPAAAPNPTTAPKDAPIALSSAPQMDGVWHIKKTAAAVPSSQPAAAPQAAPQPQTTPAVESAPQPNYAQQEPFLSAPSRVSNRQWHYQHNHNPTPPPRTNYGVLRLNPNVNMVFTQ